MSTAITENITLAAAHLSVNELKPGFGAEIHGLDFANGATEEDGRLIEELVKKVWLSKAALSCEMAG